MYIIRRHGELQSIYGDAPNAVNAARKIFAKQAEATVQRLGAGPYVMGERFTGADILLTTCLTNALRRDISLPDALGNYLSRTTVRGAYQQAIEANQPAT
jgi:glutathione S-transferase